MPNRSGSGAGLRIGLFGGSFDPIHRGHVATVLAAQEQLELDRVIYLPTAAPPHKPDRDFAPAHARLAMVEIALLEHRDLWVSAHELTPGRSAYTIETVEHFQDAQPEDEFVLLVGGDSFAALHTWRRWRDLVARIRLGVLVRPGFRVRDVEATMEPDLVALARGGSVAFVEDDPMPVSSTEIRRRLANGDPIDDDSLHPGVLEYLRKYPLYR